jgi:AraC-like DNA-binding protein
MVHLCSTRATRVTCALMVYEECPPHPALRPFVRTYWTLTGAASELAPQPVLPDGCTELIIHRARPFWRHDANGGATRQHARLFVGQLQAPVVIAPDGGADIVAIRFEPFGAFAVFGSGQDRIADNIVEADAIGERWLTRAMHEAERADSAIASLRRLESALVARLERRDAPRVDPRVTAAVHRLISTDGNARIDDVAARAGTSARHLERLFQQQVGTSPKRFARVLRFQATAGRVLSAPETALAEVSAESGYFDQAHMIRDFVTFAGQTPGQFQRHLGELTKAMLS